MKGDVRTIGRLLDTYILASVEEAISDRIVYANENREDVLAEILNTIGENQLKDCLEDIVSLCVARCVISLSRRVMLEGVSMPRLARDINDFNTNRTEAVRAIDKITNPDDLSYSPKTYSGNGVVRVTPTQILVDDYISSFVKSTLDNQSVELHERVEVLSKLLSERFSDKFSPELAVELINLSISATLCFFANEAVPSSCTDDEAIRIINDIIETDRLRKSFMKKVGKLTQRTIESIGRG